MVVATKADGIDVVVLAQGPGQFIALAGDDVDGAVRYVGSFQHALERGGGERVFGRGHDHERVAWTRSF